MSDGKRLEKNQILERGLNMSEQDKNEQTEVETIDTAGKEIGEENHHKEDAYEKICSVCHRPESVALSLIHI